jgi:hypothetical protein
MAQSMLSASIRRQELSVTALLRRTKALVMRYDLTAEQLYVARYLLSIRALVKWRRSKVEA